ncbi:catalase [Halosolutus halophilus]|uniref:catalase n=1 Tax=Halosolutus halophilus TaxID=1552990 RepID=UPI002A5A6236|nr:catalase [Halosolutus halophilus]
MPERVVHAKGGGAYGTFTVTNDEIIEYTMADMFSEEGKETDLALVKPASRERFRQRPNTACESITDKYS